MVINGVDTVDFGVRVERLCEYLLNKVDRKDDSNDIRVIQDLKEDAANLHLDMQPDIYAGLSDHLKGVPQ